MGVLLRVRSRITPKKLGSSECSKTRCFEVEGLKEETVPGLGLMLGSSISFWLSQNDRLRAVTGGSSRNDGGEG